MAISAPDITPSVAEIASHIRTRTRNRGGSIVGTFTDDTSPTDEQAAVHADRAARFVAMRLGNPGSKGEEWGTELQTAARDVAGLYAALAIEESYYGEGSSFNDSTSDQLGRMAREQLDALVSRGMGDYVGDQRMTTIEMPLPSLTPPDIPTQP